MRQRLRAVGLVALAIVAITCTDAPTSPTKIKPVPSGVANVRMSPSFSAEAARIYSGLAAFGLEVTEVHVLLTGPDGSKKDTVIAFPVNQGQITIEIPVPASGTDQSFDALVELRNDQHVVLFSGHQTVIARAANLPAQTPPLVVISYTGPGKGTKTVSLSPPDTTIAGAATVAMKATAVDSAGLPVTNLLVRFAVSDATLAVATSTGDATGTLSGLGKRGAAIVSAITPLGVTGSSRITFVPPAARIVVISGSGQTGIAGRTLTQPLVVEVQATDNLPVPNAVVTFRAVTAGGSVQQATVFADASGRASTTLTLGPIPGAYVFEAGSGALTPVSVSATATPAPAAAIAIVSGDAQVDTVGKTLPLPFVVKVTDQFGGAVGGATVTWTTVAGNGLLGATSTSTGANGTTSITYSLGTTASNDTIRASVAGVPNSVLFSTKSVSRGPATIAIVSGGNQTGLPNTTLPTPLVARVSDAQNNPIAGATVTWSATGAGASFNPVSSLTDPTGQASTVAALGANAGTTTVTATVGTVTATTTLTTVGGNTFSILAGDQQSALAGTAVALAPGVVLKDGLGNPIANAPVIFAVASGGGSITGGTTTTNSFGVATVGSWTLGATPGANRLTATSGTLSVTFTATGTTPAGPNHLVMAQGPPSPFVIGAPPVTVSVQLFDGQNNPVRQSGLVVTLAGNASPGPNFPTLTASTDNTGTATFSVPTYNGPPGTVSFDISAPGVTGLQTQAIPIVAGAASMFVITTQPSATVVNQAPFPQQPVVQLADANGNPVNTAGVVVTATFASGPTTPTPVLSNATATTNASGQATFAGMSINGPFGVYRLSFSSNLGATAAVSNTITNGAGPANTLLLFGGNGQNAPISTPVGVPPIAKVIDAQGNGVPGVVVTFTAVNSGSTVSDGTTTGTTVTVTTNSFGNAQLTAWTMSPTAGPHTVTASATVPNGSPVTFTANATAAGASKFILLSPFPTQIVVGAPHPPINIQIADANNNPVQQGNVSVNFNGNVQPGGFNFNFTLQTNAQGIINLTLSPYVGQIGNEIITIAATGFTTVTSPAIPVVAGAASTIRVTTQPPATARSGVLLSPQPVVRVVDDGNNPVSTAGIPINVNATGATVGGTTTINTNASGQAVFTDLFVAGPVGATSLQFYNPSLSPAVSTVINLTAGPAASMTIDAGNNQTVPAGSSVPILPAVLVKDAGGNPVAGVNVLFTAVTPNSYIDDVTSKTIQTNAQGIAAAQFFWQVSTTAGTNTLTASATGLANSPLTFTATGTPGPAADMKLLQAMPASITVGLPFPAVQVQLVDGNGNNVAQSNTVITATVNVQPSNTSFGLNATTASNGVATFNVQPYIGKIGTMTFILSAPSINTLVTSGITVLAGAPNKLLVTTQPPASAANGVAFTPQPAVQVNDVGSNPVNATTNVLATIASGAGTLGGTTTIATNASGLATYSNLALSGAPGSFTLRFAASGLTAVVSNNITLGTGGPSAITIVAGDQQVAAAGTSVAVAPSVRVTDGSGTPLAGVAVTFAPTLGGGSTPPGSVLTNSSGVATSGGWQLGTSVGTNNLSASVGALSATFTATAVAGPAARLAFITPPPPTAASGIALNPQPSVQLQDNFGNPVSSGGVQVTASVLSGSGALTNTTATTTTGGLATFSGLTITGPAGGVTLDFTAPNVTHIASSAITVSAGGPSAIAISAGNNQTATVGTNVATAPSVRVTDGSGNPVQSVQVTFTVTSGSGLVTGTPATTNASGVATVGSWQLGNIAGANSLSATIGALSTTFNATGVAAPPAALSFTTQPPANSASGAPLSPQPVIQVRDAFGNATAATGTVTAVITSGTGTLNNATATIGAGGVATFSALTINGSGTFTLQFQSGSLTPVSSSPITQAAGPAVGIAFSASPAGGTGGVAFSPAVTVRLVDAQSNTVTSNNTNTVTLSIAPGTGTTGATLAGPGPITFVNGVATFPSAAIDFGGTGYVL
ncbi:MAG: Ig domain protein group 1 domain protein, partial [Gemmatimonadetes bacterium]|nr:Ig domain protein group 1 domain protein [Gemmatimonadota bacterium]